MPKILKISEATSMAMHAMALLAQDSIRKITAREMAEVLQVSEHHLAKVLQRLHKAGLVKAVRGPRGGFSLGKDPGEVTLLEIYEEFEGALDPGDCLFDREICMGDNCILGGLMAWVTGQVKSYLAGTRLAELANVRMGKENVA